MSSVLRGMRRRALKRQGIKSNIAGRWRGFAAACTFVASGLDIRRWAKRKPDWENE